MCTCRHWWCVDCHALSRIPAKPRIFELTKRNSNSKKREKEGVYFYAWLSEILSMYIIQRVDLICSGSEEQELQNCIWRKAAASYRKETFNSIECFVHVSPKVLLQRVHLDFWTYACVSQCLEHWGLFSVGFNVPQDPQDIGKTQFKIYPINIQIEFNPDSIFNS